jgi:hypothetical protein
MSLPDLGAGKIIIITLIATWAAAVAIDPTVKVAVIVGVSNIVAVVVTALLGRKKLNTLQVSIDGKLSQLIDTKEQLSHAQGRREGIESTEDKKR